MRETQAAARSAGTQRTTRHRPPPPGITRRLSAASPVARMQGSAGNAAIHRLLRSRIAQTKLTVSRPGDEPEREADRVAGQILRMPAPGAAPSVVQVPTIAQRACRECEEEMKGTLDAKHSASDPPDVSPEVESYLARGHAGQPLADSTRAYFEPRFGRDFGNVRVHTDGPAADSAAALQARAYTVGSDVFFAASEYAPESRAGRSLLAHELTHVVQQGGADRSPTAALRRISRVASVTCTAGRHGAPANAEDIIAAAETLAVAAVALAGIDLQMLRLDAILPGVGAGGGFTMPTGQRLTNYQNSFGLPPAGSGGRFRDRLGGGAFTSQAEALVNESQALENRFQRIADRLSAGVRYRCIGGSTSIGDCQGHCQGRTATACLSSNLIMLCPDFWTDSMGTRALLLVHEVAHLAFSIRHGRNFTHADCYANYAADAGAGGWNGIPPCAP